MLRRFLARLVVIVGFSEIQEILGGVFGCTVY